MRAASPPPLMHKTLARLGSVYTYVSIWISDYPPPTTGEQLSSSTGCRGRRSTRVGERAPVKNGRHRCFLPSVPSVDDRRQLDFTPAAPALRPTDARLGCVCRLQELQSFVPLICLDIGGEASTSAASRDGGN